MIQAIAYITDRPLFRECEGPLPPPSTLAWQLNNESSTGLNHTKLFAIMDDFISKLLTFPPVPAPAESLSEPQYDQSIRAVSQLLESAPPGKLASGLSTGEDVLDVSDGGDDCIFFPKKEED